MSTACYHRWPYPATRHHRLLPGRGRRLRPIVNDKRHPAPNQSPSGFRGSTLAEEDVLVRIGLERTTAAPSRGLCGPPTVGAKDSLIGLLERGTHRRQRISTLSTATLVRKRLPYHLGSRPTQTFGEGPPVLHYVDRE